jgi:hypothetical protein
VEVPFDGGTHGEQLPPHEPTELFGTHAPPQLWNPGLHATPQLVPSHVAFPFAGTGHGAQLTPHDNGEVLLRHALPHA